LRYARRERRVALIELRAGHRDQRAALGGKNLAQRAIDAQKEFSLQRAARLARQPELAVHRAEVGLRDRVIRAQARGLQIGFGGAHSVALGKVRRAQVVVRLGEVRLEANRPAVALDGVLKRAAVLEHVAQRVVIKRGAAVCLDRLAQACLRCGELAAAVVRFAQDVQGVGIARLAAQCFLRQRQRRGSAARREELAALQNQVKRGLVVVLRGRPPMQNRGILVD
jgi:hypothetical protein